MNNLSFDIKPLNKKLKADYLNLFDNMIHKENPDWSKCYCNDYHFLGDVETCTRADSRDMIIDRIDRNELQGYLVYDMNEPVGWCNANDRSNYQRLLRDFDLIDNPNDRVYSIVCFLIHPKYRRQGITQLMLNKIMNDQSNSGYDYIESYPRKGVSNNKNFNGPIELYQRNGFMIHKEHEGFYVMRKELNLSL